MRKITFAFIVAGLVTIFSMPSQAIIFTPPDAPPKWDSRIPLPTGAKFKSSSTPKGAGNYSADFVSPLGYSDLVRFYDAELPKAGFITEERIVIPARKVYQCAFRDKAVLDKIVVGPSQDDPALLIIHIFYTGAAGSGEHSP